MNTVSYDGYELLIILVGNLENAAVILLTDFNQSGRNGRFKTDLNACRIRCQIIEVQCDEVSCAPRSRRFTATDVFERTCDSRAIYSNVRALQRTDRNAVNFIGLCKRLNREAYEGFTVTRAVAL